MLNKAALCNYFQRTMVSFYRLKNKVELHEQQVQTASLDCITSYGTHVHLLLTGLLQCC